MLKRLFPFIFCCLTFYSYAQTRLSGEVTNVAGDKLAGATIMIKNNAGYVQQYTSTSSTGAFDFTAIDTLLGQNASMEVSLLGYKKDSQHILIGKSYYKIILEESTTFLDEVKVKPRGIISIGDTLRYDVSSFAKEEDRSIGEVIRRLPGVTVDDEGKIYFNGKAISNLFIHGDDLMDGRYGLATKAITKDMIKSIDVMKNHQPIKVLKDRVPSDDVGMNLVLKDENSLKLNGQADIGYGPVDLLDLGVTPLLLNKKIKTLSSLKYNNIGNDFSKELNQLGTTLTGNIQSTGLKTILSRPGSVSLDVPKQNYYFNNSAVFNTNNIYNFQNGWQLKTNLQLHSDRNTVDYFKSSQVFLENQTLEYVENYAIENKPFNFQSSFTLSANKTSYFLENKLSYTYGKFNNYNQLVFNGENIGSSFRERKSEFLNSLYYIPQLKNNDIIDFRWTTGYYRAPQRLAIDTGVNADFFNNGIAYQHLIQDAEIPSYINQMSLSFRKKTEKWIRRNYEIALQNEVKDFESSISLLPFGSMNYQNYSGDNGNRLKWQQHRLQFNPNFSLDKNSWVITLSTPLVYRYVHYDQQDYELKETTSNVVFLPRFHARYKFNAEDELGISYSKTDDIGNLSSVYQGYLVQDFRSVSKSHTSLFNRRTNNYGLNYRFERSIHMFFASLAANYQQSTQNNMMAQSFDQNLEEVVYLAENNEQKNWIYKFSIGKYIFPISSNLNFDISYLNGESEQYINQRKLPFTNNSLSINGFAVTKPVDFLSFDFKISLNKFWSQSKTSDAEFEVNNKLRNLNVSLNTSLSLIKNVLINSKVYYVKNNGLSGVNSSSFFDANVRYTIKKWKSDINLNLINLLDTRQYKQNHLFANQIVYTNYNLRGRMAVFSTNFYF